MTRQDHDKTQDLVRRMEEVQQALTADRNAVAWFEERRQVACVRIQEREAEERRLQEELERLRPVWHRWKGKPMPIVEMDDKHLVNAILVCLRCDPRYFRGHITQPSRQVQLVQMVLEAQRRGLLKHEMIQAYLKNIEAYAYVQGGK